LFHEAVWYKFSGVSKLPAASTIRVMSKPHIQENGLIWKPVRQRRTLDGQVGKRVRAHEPKGEGKNSLTTGGDNHGSKQVSTVRTARAKLRKCTRGKEIM
jgi:hypothetical protein